jgi:hypothetical protein
VDLPLNGVDVDVSGDEGFAGSGHDGHVLNRRVLHAHTVADFS